MAAAVSATTVETTTTAMIATAAVEAGVAMKAASSIATMIAATDVAVTSVSVTRPIAVASTIKSGMAIVAVAPVTATVVSRAPVAVIPGASADEDAAYEVVRAIVAVGSA